MRETQRDKTTEKILKRQRQGKNCANVKKTKKKKKWIVNEKKVVRGRTMGLDADAGGT
jgi:hypothetical protein